MCASVEPRWAPIRSSEGEPIHLGKRRRFSDMPLIFRIRAWSASLLESNSLCGSLGVELFAFGTGQCIQRK
jgi:hypothetical protein